MSSTIIDSPKAAVKSGTVRSWFAFAMEAAQRSIARIRNMIRIRRNTAALLRLDDRMLADVGLSRGEVEYAVRHGRRPSESPVGADR
jgi:uncharacterized protein YjiS (DUF1127 family)